MSYLYGRARHETTRLVVITLGTGLAVLRAAVAGRT